MSPGEIYDQLWQEYLSAAQKCESLINAVSFAEHKHVKQGHVFDTLNLNSTRIQYARKITTALVAEASVLFSPPGAPKLDIDEKPVMKMCDKMLDHYNETVESFTPSRIWDALVKHYGDGKGVLEGYKQCAKNLASALHIKFGTEVKRNAQGWVILYKTIWLNDIALNYHNKTQLSYNSQRSMAELFNSLRVLAHWASMEDLAEGITPVKHRFDDHNHSFESRDRIHIGQDILIVTYNGKFEFRISPTLAGQLHLFLSSYHPEMQRGAA